MDRDLLDSKIYWMKIFAKFSFGIDSLKMSVFFGLNMNSENRVNYSLHLLLITTMRILFQINYFCIWVIVLLVQSFPFDVCNRMCRCQLTRHSFDARKKKHVPLLFMTLIVQDIGTKKMKERTKTSNLIVDFFSLTCVNLSLAWMLYFHVWCQNIGKFLVLSEYYNQFDIYHS